jgi:hypothetical protein
MGQVKICLRRGFWRLKADPSLTLFQLFGNFVMALIVSSVFYNLPAVCNKSIALGPGELTFLFSEHFEFLLLWFSTFLRYLAQRLWFRPRDSDFVRPAT